jgi:hypothetical protein
MKCDRPIQRFDLARFLRQALNELHLPQKAIAIDLRRGAPSVSRVLGGEVPLPQRWVSELSVDVQRAMCAAWATDLGLFIGERARFVEAARAIVELAQQEETNVIPFQAPGARALARRRVA